MPVNRMVGFSGDGGRERGRRRKRRRKREREKGRGRGRREVKKDLNRSHRTVVKRNNTDIHLKNYFNLLSYTP